MKLKKNEKRKSESGAIMLEVVAVLSLMGLMGTVLYRQIYQRNQELHNIQMASEIRIVKEAFSAWIHANTAPLYTMCRMSDLGTGNVSDCSTAVPLDEVKSYLPDGYFFEAGGNEQYLTENYDFHLFGYWRGRGSAAIPTYYGVVVPKPGAMLPDGGGNPDTWNFRRAARVAMLIGIDGGAYDPNITKDEKGNPEIVGSVGTWSLLADGILFKSGGEASTIPTYVAMTGLDVFQPEVELPSIQAGLPETHWSMAFQGLNAYGLFTVGQDEGCFARSSRQATANADGVFELQSDTINAPGTNCQPAFWVTTGKDATNEENGHVYVLNDLHVGADPSGGAESAIQLKKEGAIVFNQKAKDLQNENKDTNYLLDPAYTSVMNDVKLMSRGGAKLSEILPNYILKDVQRGKEEVTVTLPECPKGYVVGIRANPISWSDEIATDTRTIDGKTDPADDGHTHDLNDISVTLPPTLAKAKERQIVISEGETCNPGETNNGVLNDKTDKVTACMGWKDKGSTDPDDFVQDEGAVLEVSVYCIWPGDLDLDGDGKKDIPKNDSYTFEKPDSKRTDLEESYCNSFNNAPGTCTLMGCQWDNGNCKK